MKLDRCPDCRQEIPPEFWENASWPDHLSVCRDNLKAEVARLRDLLRDADEALWGTVGPQYYESLIGMRIHAAIK